MLLKIYEVALVENDLENCLNDWTMQLKMVVESSFEILCRLRNLLNWSETAELQMIKKKNRDWGKSYPCELMDRS